MEKFVPVTGCVKPVWLAAKRMTLRHLGQDPFVGY